MHWYLEVFKRFSDYSGRSRRKEFWYFMLFHFIILFSLASLQENYIDSKANDVFSVLLGVYLLIVFIPFFGVIVRRLHDSGKSGWYLFIYLVPIVGPITTIVLLCFDSEYGPNKYGDNPKGIGNEKDEFEEINRHLIE